MVVAHFYFLVNAHLFPVVTVRILQASDNTEERQRERKRESERERDSEKERLVSEFVNNFHQLDRSSASKIIIPHRHQTVNEWEA